MSDWAKWLEISGYGLDLLGTVVGAWYIASKLSERVRSDADKELASSLDEGVKRHAPDAPFEKDLNTFPDISHIPDIHPFNKETVPETGAEELLTERMSPIVDPFIDLIFKWGERAFKKLEPLGRLRIILLTIPGLVFFVVLLLLEALLLPLIAVGYFFDIDKDYRLRIIVMAFMAGTILQIIKAFIH